jgi:hypothetical protein
MTCSSAAPNSSARRPWVTSTRPIIGNSVLSDIKRRLWGRDDRTIRIKSAKSARTAAPHTAYTSCNVQHRPKTFQLTSIWWRLNRRWPAALVMARQKVGISRQCERAKDTFAFQTEGRLSASGSTFRTCRDSLTMSVDGRKADLALGAASVFATRHCLFVSIPTTN